MRRRALRDDRDAAHRRHPAAAGDAAPRWASCSICSAFPPTRATSPRSTATARPGASRRADRLEPGAPLPAPAPIFPRYVEPRGGRSAMRLIDSHCHLDFPDFAEETRGGRRARRRGGRRAAWSRSRRASRMATGCRARRAVSTTSISPSARIPIRRPRSRRPTSPRSAPSPRIPNASASARPGSTTTTITRRATSPAKVFRAQIALARELDLPLVIHARDADDDMAAILREEMGKGAFSAVLHCFTSSRALAETGLALGLYVSFSGVLTFKNSARLARRSRATFRSTGCWSRPTRPISRRPRIAASATSRPSSSETARVLAEVKGRRRGRDRRRDARQYAAAVRQNAERWT